jgi:hypothetical protein
MKQWHVLAVCAALFLFGVSLAMAHSFYDSACCSTIDCYPVAEGAIIEKTDGFEVVATGEFIRRDESKVRLSPDGQWHRCSHGGKTDAGTICIYVPGRGA